jgi:CCR4-NOT transcription complex subunit 6
VSLPPSERDWIILDETQQNNSDADADKFQVVSFNILCDKYATASQYGYAPSWVLDWCYRKELIKRQLLDSGADFICLQEVDMDSFQDYFMPELAMAEYKGVYQPKSRAKTMTESERKKVDGCATFFNAKK